MKTSSDGELFINTVTVTVTVTVIFRSYEGRDYSWRDCQLGEEFECSVSHNNVIVTTRANNITQSGHYNFSCGGPEARAVCFAVQVGVISSPVNLILST